MYVYVLIILMEWFVINSLLIARAVFCGLIPTKNKP